MHLLYVSIKYINIVFIMEYGTLHTDSLVYRYSNIETLYPACSKWNLPCDD